jgi:hypothetical protein
VLSKPTVAERKSGLMSGCDHPLCWLYTGLAERFSCTRDGH